jgi:hypothetical protein
MPAADSFAARETHVTLSETAKLRLWTLTKVPLLFFLRPSVVEATDRRCVIRVPLTRRSRNHLGSMYFGAFCAGASFFKRAEGDVLFACDDGEAIAGLVRRAIESGEREELPVRVLATVPEKLGSEPVAEFLLTLSLKRRD